jgi:hypothetical protein
MASAEAKRKPTPFTFNGRPISPLSPMVARIEEFLSKQQFKALFDAAHIADSLGISARSVREYNHILADHGLLVIWHNHWYYGSRKSITDLRKTLRT